MVAIIAQITTSQFLLLYLLQKNCWQIWWKPTFSKEKYYKILMLYLYKKGHKLNFKPIQLKQLTDSPLYNIEMATSTINNSYNNIMHNQ